MSRSDIYEFATFDFVAYSSQPLRQTAMVSGGLGTCLTGSYERALRVVVHRDCETRMGDMCAYGVL